MSQRPCPYCKRLIDSRLERCPHCGRAVVIRFDDDTPGARRRGCGWKAAVIVALFLGAIGGIGWYLYQLNLQSIAEEMAHEARLDSISAVHRELARLDSIKRDSIEWADFTTPDLALFELHGHVSSLAYEGDVEVSYRWMDPMGNVSFDRNGCIISDLPMRRDDDGRPVALNLVNDSTGLFLNWRGDRLTGLRLTDGDFVWCERYDGSSDIVQRMHVGREGVPETTVNCGYGGYDKCGNWTNCRWSATRTVAGDAESKPVKQKFHGTVVRTIHYYPR